MAWWRFCRACVHRTSWRCQSPGSVVHWQCAVYTVWPDPRIPNCFVRDTDSASYGYMDISYGYLITRSRFHVCSIAQRTHDVNITSLWRPNYVMTSFWRHSDVIIAPCIRWDLPPVSQSYTVYMETEICEWMEIWIRLTQWEKTSHM